MNKKIIILVVVLIFVVTGLIVAIYLRTGNPSPEINNNETMKQAVQQKFEKDESINTDLQEITSDLDSINEEDFGEDSLSDASIGLQ